MSLRARLVAGLIATAVVGLVAFGLVTYLEQRSFLLARIDQQTIAAITPASFELDQAGANVPGTGHHKKDGDDRRPPPPAPRR